MNQFGGGETDLGQTARRLHDAIIEANIDAYRDLLENQSLNGVTDGYWSELIPFYRAQDQQGRQLILAVMSQVSVDAVSSVLALIEQDGVDLTIPDLQDAFLEENEARSSR